MTINCKGKLIDLSSPKVMGILNITPDSFFDGGKHRDENQVLSHVEKMLVEGAAFIDVGAYSSRPGAKEVSEKEELDRIVPTLDLINKHFPEALISIDTFRSKVAKEGLEAGAAIINDISAGNLDSNMFPTVAAYKAPYIMMHMQGTPQNMQDHPTYNDIVHELILYFSKKIKETLEAGIEDVIIDPGFGFGKTIDHNYELLSKLSLFKSLDKALLVGISRKSMIYKPLDTTPDLALNGTTALHMASLINGANILRVHDVKEAVECVKLYEQLHKNFKA